MLNSILTHPINRYNVPPLASVLSSQLGPYYKFITEDTLEIVEAFIYTLDLGRLRIPLAVFHVLEADVPHGIKGRSFILALIITASGFCCDELTSVKALAI
jgi:hypothetical protein